MNPCKITLEEILADFQDMEDYEERFAYIIDLAKTLPEFPESERIEENIVHGCMSQVFLKAWFTPAGTIEIQAEADAIIVKGLVALVIIIYCGKTAAEIVAINIQEIFDTLGLAKSLSPNRRNGFFSMVKRIVLLAQNQITLKK